MKDMFFDIKIERMFNKLKQQLIKSFTNYFGNENKYKIEKVINQIKFAILYPNMNEKKINNIIEYYKELIEQFEKDKTVLKGSVNSSFAANHNLKPDEYNYINELYYLYNFYLILKDNKINDTDTNVLIYKENINNKLYEKFIEKTKKADKYIGGDTAINEKFISQISEKIDIRIIIHEIVHTLMQEEILEYNHIEISHPGRITIDSEFRLFNELIVEYITEEVLNNYKKENENNNLFITEYYNSMYLEIDEICNNIVYKTYNLIKPIIKKELLIGNSNKIMKIIGQENILYVEALMDNIIKKILENDSEENINIFVDKEEQEKIDIFIKKIYYDITESYKKYLETTKLEQDYVDKLEKEGLVRKV